MQTQNRTASAIFGEPVTFYTTERTDYVNMLSEQLIETIPVELKKVNEKRRESGKPELITRCQILGPSEIAKLNGAPTVVIFDDRYHDNFTPTALGKYTTGLRIKMPSWVAKSTLFGIRIGTHCTKEHLFRNCARQAITWFLSERFIEQLEKGNFPWGTRGRYDH